MNDNKTITRNLRCNLTQPELVEAARSSAELTRGISALENDKSRINKDYAARIAEKEAQRSIINDTITSGYEFREVKCQVDFDKPNKGQKTVTRLDTNEVVSVETMTAEEMQRELDLDGYKFNPDGVCVNPGKIRLCYSQGVEAVLSIARHPVDESWYAGICIDTVKSTPDMLCRIENTPYDTATGAAQSACERFRQYLTSRMDKEDGDESAGAMHAWLLQRLDKIATAVNLVAPSKEVVVE